MKGFILCLGLLFSTISFSAVGLAADTAQGSSEASVQTNTSFLSNLKIIGGLKSFNDFGRGREMSDPVGRRLKSKNEYFIGAKTKEGWGLQVMAVETANFKGDPNKNTMSPSDPSITIHHPIMETDTFKMNGSFRQYFPVSDNSVTTKQWQQAYYLNTGWKLKNKVDLFNQLIPRYFGQQNYKPTDATFYTEDYTQVTRPLTKWLRVGLGQHSQFEVHPVTAAGFVADIYPVADIMITPSVFFGPRLYFPVIVNGAVYDSARSVSMNEMQSELYLNATL